MRFPAGLSDFLVRKGTPAAWVLAGLLLLFPSRLIAQEGFVPLGPQSQGLTRQQLDAFLNSTGNPRGAPSPWSALLPGGKMAGLPGGLGFGLGWVGALAGNIPKGQGGIPLGPPGSLAEITRLLQLGQPGTGLDPAALKKMLEGFGANGGAIQGLSPMEMGNWLQLFGTLAKNRETLERLNPDLDWSKLGPLLEKINLQRAAGLDGTELARLRALLERLSPGKGQGILGPSDIQSVVSLLGRIGQGPGATPFSGGVPGFGVKPSGQGATLESLGITPENIGRFTDFLKRMGLNTAQIEQLSNLLSRIPAPGMKGDLGHWLAKFDWDKLRPGKWQMVFPKWSRDWFDRIRPNLGFLRNLKLPSFNFRAPNLNLPSPGAISLPSFSLPDRSTLYVLGGGAAGALLLVWAYLWLAKLGLAPDLKKVLGIDSHDDQPDTVERFRLVYEGLALELLGHQALSFHHQRLATGLARTMPGRDGQLAYLGELYERARYLPDGLRPTCEQAEEGLRAIARLVRDMEAPSPGRRRP